MSTTRGLATLGVDGGCFYFFIFLFSSFLAIVPGHVHEKIVCLTLYI